MSAPSLSQLTVQRLAYVRFLYLEGIEHSSRPTPLSASALLSFHDAVENFLGLVAEHLDVDVKPRIEFLQYWETIKPKVELPGEANMKRLNDARVSLKHNGTFPSQQGIEQAREAVIDFFTTVTPKVFNVDFDTIDMIDLVSQPRVAHWLRDARDTADTGDYPAAMARLTLAWEALLRHYAGNNTNWGWEQVPFSFGPTMYMGDEPQARRHDRKTERLWKLSEIAEQTQEALRVIGLGIDSPSMARFKALAPAVHGAMDGSRWFNVLTSDESLTADDFAWALQFVIESSLRAAGADAVLDLQEKQMQTSWGQGVEWERRELPPLEGDDA